MRFTTHFTVHFTGDAYFKSTEGSAGCVLLHIAFTLRLPQQFSLLS